MSLHASIDVMYLLSPRPHASSLVTWILNAIAVHVYLYLATYIYKASECYDTHSYVRSSECRKPSVFHVLTTGIIVYYLAQHL